MVGIESCKCKFVTVVSMKAYRGNKHIPPLIIYLKSRQKQVVNFTPLLIYPPRETLSTTSTGGWVGSRARLEIWKERRIVRPYLDSNPELSSPYMSPILTTLPWLQVSFSCSHFVRIHLLYVNNQGCFVIIKRIVQKKHC
jgi:hypothetical protein